MWIEFLILAERAAGSHDSTSPTRKMFEIMHLTNQNVQTYAIKRDRPDCAQTHNGADLAPVPIVEHGQVWVKVNAQVDSGIARVISALSTVNGLQTVASCEGTSDRPAYIYFYYGDWRKLGEFLFERLGPALCNALEDQATVSMEIFNTSDPMAKLTFNKEATDVVASLSEQLLHDRP